MGLTTTAHCHGYIGFSSTSTITGASFVFRANPYLSVVNTGTLSGAGLNPTITATGMASVGGSGNFYGVTSPANMQAKLETFRTTSWGIKIKLLTPPLSRTGRIIVASLPDVNPTVGYNAVVVYGVGAATTGANSLCAGIAPSLAASSAIINYPYVKVIDCANTSASEYLFTGLPVSSDSATFRNSETGVDFQSGVTQGQMVQSGTTTTTTGDRFDSLTAIGWNAFVIYAEGFPTSSPMFEIEYIYHFEGTPTVGAMGALAVDAPEVLNRTHGGWQQYLDAASRQAAAFVSRAGEATGNILNSMNASERMMNTLLYALNKPRARNRMRIEF